MHRFPYIIDDGCYIICCVFQTIGLNLFIANSRSRNPTVPVLHPHNSETMIGEYVTLFLWVFNRTNLLAKAWNQQQCWTFSIASDLIIDLKILYFNNRHIFPSA